METTKIQILIDKQGKKRSQLADFLKVSRSNVTMWFTRKSIPKEYIPDVALFLNTTSDDLLECYLNNNTKQTAS